MDLYVVCFSYDLYPEAWLNNSICVFIYTIGCYGDCLIYYFKDIHRDEESTCYQQGGD